MVLQWGRYTGEERLPWDGNSWAEAWRTGRSQPLGRGSSQYKGPEVGHWGGIILASKEDKLWEPWTGRCGQNCARERSGTSHYKHANTRRVIQSGKIKQKRVRRIVQSLKISSGQMTSYAIWTKPVSIKVTQTQEQKETDKMMKWRWKMLIRIVEMETCG